MAQTDSKAARHLRVRQSPLMYHKQLQSTLRPPFYDNIGWWSILQPLQWRRLPYSDHDASVLSTKVS